MRLLVTRRWRCSWRGRIVLWHSCFVIFRNLRILFVRRRIVVYQRHLSISRLYKARESDSNNIDGSRCLYVVVCLPSHSPTFQSPNLAIFETPEVLLYVYGFFFHKFQVLRNGVYLLNELKDVDMSRELGMYNFLYKFVFIVEF